MRALYSLSICIYNIIIHIAAIKSNKAKLWVKGRLSSFKSIELEVKTDKPLYWFHAASLGEFEQGRPVIEKLKATKDCFILLTFFSPSGYEIQKNYKFADYVCYLPVDSRTNAKKFIQLIKPEAAIFIKYEFWFNYLNELRKKDIKTYLISGIFRQNQHFFKFYGSWFRNQLKSFTYFFLQNKESIGLLENIGFSNSTISGDTRFDRVLKLKNEEFNNPIIESFCKDNKVIVAGSTWENEHALIYNFIKSGNSTFKYIIAPHEINQKKIHELKERFEGKAALLSEIMNDHDLSNLTVLIIDKIGLLSKLYRFADLSIIGGGFGSGIHNTLEAAVYGSPILFGPNYHKFQEAKDLISNNAAISFSNPKEFNSALLSFLNNEKMRKKYSQNAKDYVNSQAGASELILKEII